MYNKFYFLGIGGIGMSAIARYFKAKGFAVAGYDRTRSQLCCELETEGIDIHYTPDTEQIAAPYRDAATTLVVYTPAIPTEHVELVWFRENGFEVEKRAQVLGHITETEHGLCVAGTHGKTTISIMAAHLLKQSHVDCNAFLGGISKNYTSNLLLSDHSDLVVIEADEFDRSFHHLRPYMAVISAVDADHLDIYGTYEAYLKSFEHFTSLIRPGGCLIMKKGLALQPRLQAKVRLYTYSATEPADFYAENVRINCGSIVFDFVVPDGIRIKDIALGVPVPINVENGVAAMALAWLNGATPDEIRHGMASYSGIRRRFDIHLKTDRLTIIDDYAHHPKEIEASIKSVKAIYAGKKVLGVFQPHLYTRTRDFYREFAAALSHLDEVILVELYPAREQPIEGISSATIYDWVTCTKTLTTKAQLIDVLRSKHFDVLLTLGAGDLDTMVDEICKELTQSKI